MASSVDIIAFYNKYLSDFEILFGAIGNYGLSFASSLFTQVSAAGPPHK